MAILELRASLPSGRSETVSVPKNGTVGDLKWALQTSLGQTFLKLAAPDGRLLDDPTESLEHAGLQDRDTITTIVQQPKIVSTSRAFALWLGGSEPIVAWGDPAYGGDVSKVQHKLKHVRQICASRSAFAAILADGRVVTWGSRSKGGDSSRVQEGLRNARSAPARVRSSLSSASWCAKGRAAWQADEPMVKR
eukprot:Skav205296  [mRNA]  locus=scaffold1587:135882:138392:- [translate_table: standard]